MRAEEIVGGRGSGHPRNMFRKLVNNFGRVFVHGDFGNTMFVVVEGHAEVVMGRTNGFLEVLAVNGLELIDEVLNHEGVDMRDVQIVNMPAHSKLFIIDLFVRNAGIVWIDGKTQGDKVGG